MTKPFLRTLSLTIVCFKVHDRKLQMQTSQHKVLSHNAFVFCCKLFFSIVVIWCAILNIKYRVRKKAFGPMRFFIFNLSEFPNFPCFFLFFFFEIYFWKRLCGFAAFFLSSFTTFFSPYCVVLRICIFIIFDELKRGFTGVVSYAPGFEFR